MTPFAGALGRRAEGGSRAREGRQVACEQAAGPARRTAPQAYCWLLGARAMALCPSRPWRATTLSSFLYLHSSHTSSDTYFFNYAVCTLKHLLFTIMC